MERYDAVVLGLGGVGSAALYHLAKRGVRALGIEQFGIAHDRGSSHGDSRAIRKAYFEHPAYVPLLRRAYELWDELEAAAGRELLHRTGVLQVGPADGEVVAGVLASAKQHGLAVEQLSAGAVQERFPGFRVPPGSVGLFEADAGWLNPDACVEAHIAAADEVSLERGEELADCWTGTRVTGWTDDSPDLIVHTDAGDVRTGRLLVAGGPWAARLLGLPLTVLRKTLHWYGGESAGPVWLYERPEGVFYGFPSRDGVFKAAEHSGGRPTDPDAVERTVGDEDRAALTAFLRRWRVGVGEPVLDRTCLYSMSDDGHFRLGHLGGDPRIRYVAGLSGHGFKFTSVLGELLAGEGELISPLR